MIYLDFDGVLFDSAREAFAVGHLTQFAALPSGELGEARWSQFRAVRFLVNTAWHYRTVFDSIAAGHDAEEAQRSVLDSIARGRQNVDAEFESRFFQCRNECIARDRKQWLELSPPYPFFHAITPWLKKYPDRFAILSTRNEHSIREILAHSLATTLPVIMGGELFAKFGTKADVLRNLHRNAEDSLFIDDCIDHLPEMAKIPHLQTFHAKWGYVDPADALDNSAEAVVTIQTFLRED